MEGRIDTHIHVIPPSYRAALDVAGGDPSGWPTPEWTPESCLSFMDSVGIHFAVLSVTSPGPAILGPTALGRKVARAANEEVAGYVTGPGKGRFGFFASLPDWNDVEGTLEEIEFVYTQQKVANGLVIMTSYGEPLPGDPSFAAIWEALERNKALVFVHPGTTAPLLPPVAGFLPRPVLDYPLATTRCAVDLILTGTMSRCPSIDVILSHAGGTLPFIGPRALGAPASPLMADKCGVDAAGAIRDAKRLYYDIALSTSVPQLMALLTNPTVDHGRILFGSDFPYAPTPVIRQVLQQYKSFVGEQALGKAVEPARLDANGLALLARHRLERSVNVVCLRGLRRAAGAICCGSRVLEVFATTCPKSGCRRPSCGGVQKSPDPTRTMRRRIALAALAAACIAAASFGPAPAAAQGVKALGRFPPSAGGGLAPNAPAATTKKTTPTRPLVKVSAERTNMPCRSGTWPMSAPYLAVYEDEYDPAKTAMLATVNQFGANVRHAPGGAATMHLLRNAPGKAPRIFPGLKTKTGGPVYIGGGAVITSSMLLSHGRVGTWIRAGPRAGPGVIFAWITMADNAVYGTGDEIDFEWVIGSEGPNKVEYAYYLGGIPTDAPNFYNYGGVISNPTKKDFQRNFHYYEIEWTASFISWYIDKIKVKTVRKADLKYETLRNGTRYKQFPVKFPNVQWGIWDAGSSPLEGTRTWGGGLTNWARPYNDADGYSMTILNFTVTCYT
ncbi:hypothetical protein DFJ74DRAFT_742231 [Hyaloraphidium curvatum]|nr:hypothetical protein DFJ74DRAFT_742231 [Hyaloraphidium curvatum]